MELLDRYLQAVGEHLPVKGRQDTLAELRANLLDDIEEREEAANRPLTEAEIASVLEAHGMPIVVAARYMPQRSLIGPAIFPFYWYTLKASFPWVVLAYVALQGVRIAIQGEPLSILPDAILHFGGVALTFWAIMTLFFAAVEYVQQNYCVKAHLPRWSARDLPGVEPEEKNFSMAKAVADVIVSVLGILWFLAVPAHPYLMFGPGAKLVSELPFKLTPGWHTIYWETLALLTAMIPLKVAMLFRGLRSWRTGLQLGVGGLVILSLVILVNVRTFLVPVASTTADTLKTLNGINAGVTLGFKIALTVSSIKLAWDLWQSVRCAHQPKASCAVVF